MTSPGKLISNPNDSWVELFLLLLLVLNLVFLVVEVSSPKGRAAVWGARWTDYGLFIIFVLYTYVMVMDVTKKKKKLTPHNVA